MDHLNSTHHPTNQSDFSSVFTRQALPVLYAVICVVGVSLNSVAAWIFCRVPSNSCLVVYLKNMVVADFLMLATFPFRVAAEMDLGGWRLHVVVCRYSAVLFYSSMYVGIIFIGLISLERYVRIVPHSPSLCSSRLGGLSLLNILQSVGFAQVLALLTWTFVVLCALPNVVLTSRPANKDNARRCIQLKTPLGVKWHQGSILLNVTLFWATLLVLAFCYTSIAWRVYRSYRRVHRNGSHVHRKSNRSIFSILAVFFVCFVPYHVCRLPYTPSQMSASDFSEATRFLLFQMKEATLFLASFNVCLDPVIYFLMCRTFRESLLRKLSGKRRMRRQSLSTAQSMSNM